MAIVQQTPITLTGSDLTGNNSETNRTYTLPDDSVRTGLIIVVANAFLNLDVDFTFNEDSYLITFLNPIWDVNNITIYYSTESTEPEPESADYYTNTLKICRVTGIGVDVSSELLGLGDGTTSAYDTSNNNIIADSYTIYYTAVGSNNANNLIEDTDYLINKDRGSISLTSTGRTLTDGSNIYIDYTYSPRQSDTILNTYLECATAEVDRLTDNHWGTATSRTEYFNGFFSDYPVGDEPYSNLANDRQPEFQLAYKGVDSITSVKFLSQSGEEYNELDSEQYRLVEDNRLIINATVPNGQANVEVIYSAGYTEVPVLIKQLAALIAGKMALVNISGGSYKDISTYSIGRKSFSIGMIYVNVESSIKQLDMRINTILGTFGYNYGCV